MFLVGPSPARDYLTVRSRGGVARVFLLVTAGRPAFLAASGEGSLESILPNSRRAATSLLVPGSDQQAMQYRVVMWNDRHRIVFRSFGKFIASGGWFHQRSDNLCEFLKK